MKASSTTLVLPILLLAAFVSAGLFGAGISFAKDEHGQIMGCSFMQGHVSWCAGSPLNHLASWQAAFSTILPLLILSFFFLILAGTVLPSLQKKYFISFRSFIESVSIVPNSLALAFSNGILHPKVF